MKGMDPKGHPAGAGLGPPPCVGALVTVVNALAGNGGKGAKGAAATKGSDGKR